MSEKEFVEKLKDLNINLDENQIMLFKKYANVLMEYNEHTNLTAIRNIENIYLKHFYDSLLVLKYRKLNSEKVIDIGSGAGFPGVPLKIVCPNIDLTVLDANGKKTKFLEYLKNELNIDYIVINKRAEDCVNDVKETFDVCVSRAVSAMPVLSEISIPFVKLGGYFFAYKGDIGEDLENGIYAINTLGGEIEKVYKDTLPIGDYKRSIVSIIKKRKTNDMYPRRFDKIIKKPLQKL